MLLLVGAMVGFFAARSEAERTRAELEKIRSGGSEPAVSSSTEAPAFGRGKTYGDGVYPVGEDIGPGVYDGVVVEEQGYWARLKGTDGMVSQIIANGIVRGPFVLTIGQPDVAA